MQILWVLLMLFRSVLSYPKQQDNNMCLAIYNYNTQYVIQVSSGTVTSLPFLAPEDRRPRQPISRDAISHNRRKIVNAVYSRSKYFDSEPPIFSVASVEVPYAPYEVIRLASEPYSRDIEVSWSPDDKWIIYRYQVSDRKAFIGIADTSGKKLREFPIETTKDRWTNFNGWSADCRYFALLQQQKGDEYKRLTYTVRFYSIPDLNDVTPTGIGVFDERICAYNNYNYYSDCMAWSPTGHSVAFINTESNLVLIELDGSTKSFRPLPYKLQEVFFNCAYLLWSSDNKHIAVSALLQDSNNSDAERRYRLYVFSKTDRANLGINELGTIHDVETVWMQWAWSEDGKTLYFMRANSGNSKLFDITAYQNGKLRIIKSIPNTEINIDFYPAPDNSSLVVLAKSWDSSILYWLTNDGNVIEQYENAQDNNGYLIDKPLAWLSGIPARLAIIAGQKPEILVYESDGKLIMRKSIDKLDLEEFEWFDWTPCSEQF